MMTSNTAEQKNVIGKKELRSIFLRSLSLEYSWNYERQQNMGYCFAMLPAIKKIYQKKEDQIAAAKRHMNFLIQHHTFQRRYLEFQQQWKRATLEMKISIHHLLTM